MKRVAAVSIEDQQLSWFGHVIDMGEGKPHQFMEEKTTGESTSRKTKDHVGRCGKTGSSESNEDCQPAS